MNTSAERHLDKAQGYLAKGEEFYLKAAEEILAAKNEGLTHQEIGDYLGRGKSWVSDTLKWYSSDRRVGTATPWSGAEHSDKRAAQHTRRVLRDAPLEQVEQIIADLPAERQKAVAAAAGHEYLKARSDYETEERDRTPAERKEREAAGEALTQKVREASGGFAALGIAGHMEQALEELQELDSFTAENLRPIIDLHAAIGNELVVKAAMVDLEFDLQEV